MRRGCRLWLLVVLIGGFAGTAEAGMFSTIGKGVVWTWNLGPQIITVLNGGVHLVCDTLCGHPAEGHKGICGAVHSTIHSLADVLTIDDLP